MFLLNVQGMTDSQGAASLEKQLIVHLIDPTQPFLYNSLTKVNKINSHMNRNPYFLIGAELESSTLFRIATFNRGHNK